MSQLEPLAKRIQAAGFTSPGMEHGEEPFISTGSTAFIAPPLDTIPSPHGNAIYTIVEEYAARYPEPCIVIAAWPTQGKPADCAISSQIYYCRQPFRKILFEDFIPHRVKRALWGTGRPEYLHYIRQAARLCRLLQIRTVIIEDIPTYAWEMRRMLGKEAVIILHQHINAPRYYSREWWKRLEKSLDGIAFVADQTRKETEAWHGKLAIPHLVAYNGIDLDFYAPDRWQTRARQYRDQYQIGADETVLLYAGRLVPGKGPLEAAQAFQMARIPQTRFVLVGALSGVLYQDDAYLSNLRHLAEESRGKIILTGAKPQSEIPALYTLADAVIVPSLQAEGLPKVITEALAMGKPVLATDRGGALERIRPGINGWILDNPQDVETTIQLLREALCSRVHLQEMSEHILATDRPKVSIQTSLNTFYNFIHSTSNRRANISFHR